MPSFLDRSHTTDDVTYEQNPPAGGAHAPVWLACGVYDEPVPLDGLPLEAVAARLRDEVLPDCNRLYHPRYAGHQVSPPLPAGSSRATLTSVANRGVLPS